MMSLTAEKEKNGLRYIVREVDATKQVHTVERKLTMPAIHFSLINLYMENEKLSYACPLPCFYT